MKPRIDHTPRDQWEELIFAYLDGAASAEDVVRLEGLLTKAEFQRLLADYAIDYAALHDASLHVSFVAPAVDQNLPPHARYAPRRRSSRTWTALAASLAVAASFGLSAVFNPTSKVSPDPVSVIQVIGNATVGDVPLKGGAHVAERTVVRTQGLTSFARLGFDDGTELRLSGDAAVTCRQSDGQKFVNIISGQVSASVARQPAGRPLIIQTKSASMEVLGTDLAVAASPDKTRLNVATGSVKMRSEENGAETTVKRGQFAVAGEGTSLAVKPLQQAPSVWEVDFSRGLPTGWERGEYIPPSQAHPRGAMRTEYDTDDGYYTMIAPNVWSDGHFRVEDDAYFNFRIKMERPDWYQVILCMRDDMFRPPNGHPYHEYQEAIDFQQVAPGEWRTVSVPFSAFRLTQRESVERFADRPQLGPPPGSTTFLFLFSTQKEDRGLEIEKVWVTRGRPEGEANASTTISTPNFSAAAIQGTIPSY